MAHGRRACPVVPRWHRRYAQAVRIISYAPVWGGGGGQADGYPRLAPRRRGNDTVQAARQMNLRVAK